MEEFQISGERNGIEATSKRPNQSRCVSCHTVGELIRWMIIQGGWKTREFAVQWWRRERVELFESRVWNRRINVWTYIKSERSIEYKYREGRLKRTPGGELKDLKLSLRNHSVVITVIRLAFHHRDSEKRNFFVKTCCRGCDRMTRLETRTKEFNVDANLTAKTVSVQSIEWWNVAKCFTVGNQSFNVKTRKMVNYSWVKWSQRKLWWKFVSILTCKSFVKPGYRGERLIEPSSSWFPPKFPSG